MAKKRCCKFAPSLCIRFCPLNLKISSRLQSERDFQKKKGLGLQFWALFCYLRPEIRTYGVHLHNLVPNPRPQSLTFPLWESKIDSHRGNVKVGGLWWEKSERNCRNVKHVKLFGFSELMGYRPGGPKKFNMFNISPAGSIFLAFKPTKFNISPARSKFWKKNASHWGNVKVGGLWWEKSERNCRNVKHVKLFVVFGTYGVWPGRPKKFNMFNISPAGSIFCRFNPQSLTFPLREANFEKKMLPTGEMLNLVGFGGRKKWAKLQKC